MTRVVIENVMSEMIGQGAVTGIMSKSQAAVEAEAEVQANKEDAVLCEVANWMKLIQVLIMLG